MKNPILLPPLLKYEQTLYVFMGIFLVFISWSFIIPKINQVLGAKNSLVQEKNRLGRLQAKLADLESLNEFELAERTNIAMRAIPDKKNVVGAMSSLRVQAEEKGLTIKNLYVSPGELLASGSANPNLGSLEFRVELQGPLSAILDFFTKIEQSLPLISLRVGNIDLKETNPSLGITVETYFLPLPQTLGTIDSPVPKLTFDEEKILSQISQFSYLPPTSYSPVVGRDNPFSF